MNTRREVKLERRTSATRVPDIEALARNLASNVARTARRRSTIPLLYIEFSGLGSLAGKNGAPDRKHRQHFNAACKQATAAALKSSLGTILRRNDLIAAGRGGHWFVAALIGRDVRSGDARSLDADLGIAAQRLRQSVQIALERLRAGDTSLSRVAVRCGWNVLEPADPAQIGEALRHALRGAALVARVEERRALVLASVTHELRTPLTAIIGFSERLQSRQMSGGQRARWLSIINQEARRLHRLTEGLIDVGAWNAGGLRLQLARCSLKAIVADAIRTVADRARHRNVRFKTTGTAHAIVDRDRMLQVLVNVLDNAVRHTQHGGRVQVRLSSRNCSTTVTVRDGGSGFPRDIRKSVGMPLRAGLNGEVGLGLAIAKVLVEAHGGDLRVGGNARSGGLLSVTLPLEQRSLHAKKAV